MAQENIHKLVSLTFDEDPKVRMAAASKLAGIDDPAALFALMELSYDKDANVKMFAYSVLDKKKSNEKEVMNLTELFSSKPEEAQDAGENETVEQKKQKILSPITQLFEKRLGKQKADQVKSKMMPTIEKVYMKSKTRGSGGENGKQAIQEFLTSYLEAISDIESIAPHDTPGEIGHVETVNSGEVLKATDELEVVSKQGADLTLVNRELVEIENQERKETKEDEALESLPETVFKRAYETMLASGGDERVMQRELKRMARELEYDVKLAYNLAKKRFRETKITHITKIKNGTRNVNTDLLTVKSIENKEYKKGREEKTYTRVLVEDEKENEGVAYLFDSRGSWLKPGMKIKIVKGYVKIFDFSKETAIAITKKGNVYIVL